MNATSNPLLDDRFDLRFHDVRAEHVEPAMDALIARSQAAIQAIIDAEGPRTWANTMQALEDATEALELAFGMVGHLDSVAHEEALSGAYYAVTPKVTAFFSSIALNADLYEALKAYAATEEAQALTGIQRRFLDKTLEDFVRHGAELPEAQKTRLAELQSELAIAGNTFAQNSLKATAAWTHLVTDPSELAGVPESMMGLLKQSAEQAGQEGWLVTLQAPSVMAILTHADNAALREKVWRAYSTRATSGELDNGPVIEKMLALRAEMASLLGYDTFADYILADRMAKTGAAAQSFLDDLDDRSRAMFQAENDSLRAFVRHTTGSDDLAPWDIGYQAEKQRKALYDLDEEALRPYFPLDTVLSGLFELVHRLYGITVEPSDLPAWHEDVRTYKVLENGRHIGSFYADFFPRSNKRAGAWMNAFITGKPQADGTLSPHLGLICGNMTPPVGDRPSLLTHREVETVFHEFGHLLHHLLTTVPIRSLAGTNVAWDFVELPSQIMENWTWNRQTLDLISGHVDTGEPLPGELFDRMLKARNFRSANAMMRQLGFGQLDMALHTAYDPERDGPVQPYVLGIHKRYSAVAPPADYAMVNAFGHLFSSPTGYAAGYYSYKWAEVLDADAFSAFEKEGLFDREVGTRFRDTLLSQGNAEEPADLFQAFMGRAPDPEALLRRSGLLR